MKQKPTAKKKVTAPIKADPKKQDLFCLEYLKDFNATQAAIRAGYSKRTAYSIGHENLSKPEIQVKIKSQADRIFKAVDLEVKDVLHEVMNIAFSDINNVCDWGEQHLSLRGPEEMSPEHRRTIESIKLNETNMGINMSVKMYSKMDALQFLGKYLKMLTDQVDVTHKFDWGKMLEDAERADETARQLEKTVVLDKSQVTLKND